jgi:hypothetical protein
MIKEKLLVSVIIMLLALGIFKATKNVRVKCLCWMVQFCCFLFIYNTIKWN